jgi:MOSC domain-containing protein YiiM
VNGAPETEHLKDTGIAMSTVGVFVGQPQVIGETRQGPVTSGIAKTRVEAPELALGPTNLAGDRQADLSVHGGPDKAVYFYPADHYPTWQEDGFDVEVGGLGENVTVAGGTERDVRIGDRWRWGEATVEVSQPRAPCYKLAVHTGRKDIGPRMIATGRCGWYVRVVEPGAVPTSGHLTLVHRDPAAPTVEEAFAAMFGVNGPVPRGTEPTDRDRERTRQRVLASDALADQWRTFLLARAGEAL